MTTDAPLRIIKLIRVSGERQADIDKASIPEQHARLDAFIEQEGGILVDTIVTPGFSASYFTYLEFAQAARDEGGYTDAMRMFAHWERGDFDVLAVFDGTRFGRMKSIYAEVVGRTIKAGARLWDSLYGWVDERNADMYALVGGFSSESEVKKLQERGRIGKNRRFNDNRPTSSRMPLSHQPVRDERFRVVSAELNPQYTHLIADLAAALLGDYTPLPGEVEGRRISYRKLGDHLFARGHSNILGEPYAQKVLYNLLHNPMFWGHNARGYGSAKHGRRFGAWAYDENTPPPANIEITYDVFPAALEGELADRVKQELERRREIARGRAETATSNPFSGLVVCNACGYRMSYHRTQEGNEYYTCQRRKQGEPTDCDASVRYVPIAVIRDWVNARLRYMRENVDPDGLSSRVAVDDPTTRITRLERKIEALETRAAKLILQRTDTPDNLQAQVRQAIELVSAQLKEAEAQLQHERGHLKRARVYSTNKYGAFERFMKLDSLDTFWSLEPDQIQTTLYDLLAGRVIVITDGDVTGTKPAERASKSKSTGW
jgi:hypothetical protein